MAGLTYQQAGSPATSQFATIDISRTGNLSVLDAVLPGDKLTLGQIRDRQRGVGSIVVSAGSIDVTGVNLFNANGPLDLKATGGLTVVNSAIIQTGTGTISLAADVNPDGTGDDGVGTLTIAAGATVTSSHAAADAITLRGADIDIDTSANPAVMGAQRQLSTTPSVTLTGLRDPIALALDDSNNLSMAFDDNGNLYVVNLNGHSVSKFASANIAPPTAGGVMLRSSLSERPLSLGGADDAVAGINLTDAELARIQTITGGTLTIGDSDQTGDIMFITAKMPASKATVVLQSTSGGGKVLLDGSGTSTGLDGNGGTVTLTGGTVTFQEGSVTLVSALSVDAHGQAGFSSSSFSVGSPHVITAVYYGNVQFVASAGSISQTIQPAVLTITADDKSKRDFSRNRGHARRPVRQLDRLIRASLGRLGSTHQ